MASAALRSTRKDPARASQPVAALDIGCSKITCLIARPHASNPRAFQLIGAGRQASRGFNGGTIVDMDGLERAIRLAVEDAEREAGESIEKVVLGLTGPRVASVVIEARIPIGGRNVTALDVRRLQGEALQAIALKEVELIAAWPVAYTLDAEPGIRDPRGMHARHLGLTLAAVTIPKTTLRTLIDCIGRAHIGVSDLVPSAVASAAGTLIPDEIHNGAVCIDMGAGVTAFSVLINGSPAWTGQVPLGGTHVTSDIAQGLGTTFAAAEKLKLQHGAVTIEPGEAGRQIEAARLGDDGRLRAASLDRATLAAIIRPRIEEIFELVEARLAAAGVRRLQPRRVVLTGGASQLPGVRDVAEGVLNAPVRLSTPILAEFMGQSLATPAFATASGLLMYRGLGMTDLARAHGASDPADGSRAGLAHTVFDWLKNNF